MSPDDIQRAVARLYPDLVATKRNSPDGWSFYLGPKRGGKNSNRIFRAVRSSSDGLTKLKLAVSVRIAPGTADVSFDGNELALSSYIERELKLFALHFAGTSRLGGIGSDTKAGEVLASAAPSSEAGESSGTQVRGATYSATGPDDLDIHDASGTEGLEGLRVHLTRERDRSLIAKKKAASIALDCEVCGFSFLKTFGSSAANYCEVHHLVPLSEAMGVRETRLSDLAILCANCHRVAHLRNPPYSLDEVRTMRSSQGDDGHAAQ